MKHQSTVAALAALAGSAVAYPQYELQMQARQNDPNPWQAPPAGAVRAPCPGTNTLANHGYISRDGRGISAQDYQQGFLDAFGFEFAITAAGAQNAINQCSQITGTTCTTFDLDMLNEPHAIEHDGSLTRQDAQMNGVANPSNSIFNQDIWSASLDLYGRCNTHADTTISGFVRASVNTRAQNDDPAGWFVENDGGEEAEHGFLLLTMNDPAVGTPQNPQARLDWVDYWFVNERLPTDIGWTKPAQTIAFADWNAASAAVANSPLTANGCDSSSSTSSATSTPTGSATGSAFPTMSSAPFGNATTSSSTRTASATGTSTTNSVYCSLTSSAKAQATAIVGPQPAPINAYKQPLSGSQWVAFKTQIDTYVYHVESLCNTLLGVFTYTSGQGSGVPAAPAASGSAPAPVPAAPSYGYCPCASR